MRQTRERLFVAFASTMIVLQTVVSPVFGQTTESSGSFDFVSVDVPLPDGQLGFTDLADVNEKGQITGGFTDSNSGTYGFLLKMQKKVRSSEIRCSGKVVLTVPQSINRHGEIAGFASVIVETIKIPTPPFKIVVTKISGFFRNKSGKCTILDFPGANLTEAIGVNDDGQVVGDYRDANNVFHGFLWDAGQFLTIDVPFPATSTAPTGINNVGQIVGFYFDNNGQARGFFYDNGNFTSFDFPGAVATLPVDINDNGQIVGVFGADNDSIGRSFLLDDGGFTTFDVPFTGAIATQIRGINNRGQIVGRYIETNPEDQVNPFPSRGFVATPNINSPLVQMDLNHMP